jgi:hypothetical protein
MQGTRNVNHGIGVSQHDICLKRFGGDEGVYTSYLCRTSFLERNHNLRDSEMPTRIIAICTKVRHRAKSIKMCTFRAATSDVHISATNGPNIMILYALESSHTALLRPSIFTIQK